MDLKIKCGIVLACSFLGPVQGFFTSYRVHKAYNAHDVDKARALLASSITHNQNDWRSLINLGTIAFNEQDYENAVKHFDAALAINAAAQEAHERREVAKKLQEQKKEETREREKNQQQQEQQQRDQNNAQDSAGNAQGQEGEPRKDGEHKEHEPGGGADQSSEQNEPKREEKNKQSDNQKKENNEPAKLEEHHEQAQNKGEEGAKKEEQKRGTDQQEEDLKHSQHNEQQEKKQNTQQQAVQEAQDKNSDIPLSEQEKRLVGYIEQTDKAAQRYMLMRARGKEVHNERPNW